MTDIVMNEWTANTLQNIFKGNDSLSAEPIFSNQFWAYLESS